MWVRPVGPRSKHFNHSILRLVPRNSLATETLPFFIHYRSYVGFQRGLAQLSVLMLSRGGGDVEGGCPPARSPTASQQHVWRPREKRATEAGCEFPPFLVLVHREQCSPCHCPACRDPFLSQNWGDNVTKYWWRSAECIKGWGLGAVLPGFQAWFCIYEPGTLSDVLKLLVIHILSCKLKPSFNSYLLYYFSGKGTICGAEDTAIKKNK